MPAFIIAEVDVHDPEAYKKYTSKTPGTIADHGGRFVVRGGKSEGLEGAPPPPRTVVIEFPDYAAAKGWYDSGEYQELIALRKAASTGRMYLVDGA